MLQQAVAQPCIQLSLLAVPLPAQCVGYVCKSFGQ